MMIWAVLVILFLTQLHYFYLKINVTLRMITEMTRRRGIIVRVYT